MSQKTSKYRFAKLNVPKKEHCFIDAKPSTSVWDLSNLIAANSTVFALPWASTGGGRVTVLKHTGIGKLPTKVPHLLGHTAPVIDLAFNPFVESILATASEDATIKLWSIPADGITADVTESAATLTGHGKKVGILAFHPSAANVLASASMDNTIRTWDIEKGERGNCTVHTDQIYSMDFNLDGSLVATTSKDKKLRIVDLRKNATVAEAIGHEGLKASRSVWAKKLNQIISVGFNKDQYRQMLIWDPRNLNAPSHVEELDRLGSVMMPLVDEDTGMLYLAGKGDTTIKTYELCGEEKPPILFCADHPGADTQKGLCFLPKSNVNPRECEMVKLLRVTGNLIQPISMVLPRKLASTTFQEDVYPPTFGPQPALRADEYFGGANAVPTTVSLLPLFEGTKMASGTTTTFTPTAKDPSEDAITAAKARVEKLRAELEVAKADLAKAEKALADSKTTQ
jgi:coronin-1B/1C/6